MKNFTPEDLIEYHYNELDAEQATAVEDALKESWPLQQKLQVIKEAGIRLNKSMESPRSQVLNSILQYAASFEKTPHS